MASPILDPNTRAPAGSAQHLPEDVLDVDVARHDDERGGFKALLSEEHNPHQHVPQQHVMKSHSVELLKLRHLEVIYT